MPHVRILVYAFLACGFHANRALRIKGLLMNADAEALQNATVVGINTHEETTGKVKKFLALFVGALALVGGVPADQFGSNGPQALDRWSVLAQAPAPMEGIIQESYAKQQKMMITSTGFTDADGSDNVVARTAFDALLPLLPKGNVPKADLTALVITAPTALREGYFGNSDAPVDAESFGPQLAKAGVGNIISLDVLSKSHLNLEEGEKNDWGALMHKAYNASNPNKMLTNTSSDPIEKVDMGLGTKMVKAGAALDEKYADRIRELVSKADIIAVNGGDPAVALLAMRTSPVFTEAVMKRIQGGDAVFVGRSAGAMLAGADAGLTHEISAHVRTSLLGEDTTGLKLIPGSGSGKGAVRPHYKSDWNTPMINYESALIGKGQDVTFYGIPNGKALTCLGDECREVGHHGLSENQMVKFLGAFEGITTTSRLKNAMLIEELS